MGLSIPNLVKSGDIEVPLTPQLSVVREETISGDAAEARMAPLKKVDKIRLLIKIGLCKNCALEKEDEIRPLVQLHSA